MFLAAAMVLFCIKLTIRYATFGTIHPPKAPPSMQRVAPVTAPVTVPVAGPAAVPLSHRKTKANQAEQSKKWMNDVSIKQHQTLETVKDMQLLMAKRDEE